MKSADHSHSLPDPPDAPLWPEAVWKKTCFAPFWWSVLEDRFSCHPRLGVILGCPQGRAPESWAALISRLDAMDSVFSRELTETVTGRSHFALDATADDGRETVHVRAEVLRSEQGDPQNVVGIAWAWPVGNVSSQYASAAEEVGRLVHRLNNYLAAIGATVSVMRLGECAVDEESLRTLEQSVHGCAAASRALTLVVRQLGRYG